VRQSILKLLLIPLLLLSQLAPAQDEVPVVLAARLDAAIEQVSANLPEGDPARAALLKEYDEIRANLAEIQAYNDSRERFSNARANAADEARAIELGLVEREVGSETAAIQLSTASLQELERAIQLVGAELEASRSSLVDTSNRINDAPVRALAIRERLATLGSRIPEQAAALAVLPADVAPDSEEEADLWLAQARLARARAEKASLDEELLSQPMRLELLKAYQDQATRDIALLERRLQAMQRRASELRKGAAEQAKADAELAVADTFGKNPLLQQLASRNAALTSSFAELGSEIGVAREREAEVSARAQQLSADLKAIERKLDLLGLNLSVGKILREQQVQLPPKRQSKSEISAVAELITQSSLRQIELQDERRQLGSAQLYVGQLLEEQDEPVAEEVRIDLLELAHARRVLIEQALELENTYNVTLANLDFSLKEYAEIVADYRGFISERLLWIPSRTPFSLFREGVMRSQLHSMFAPERWATVLGQVPGEIRARPLLLIGVLLALLLWGMRSRLKAVVVNCGQEVGYVRTDRFANTLLSLGTTLLLGLRWPALLFSLALLFEMQSRESELATALYATFLRGGAYLWGLEFMRLLLMPKGVVEAHFLWPTRRVSALYHRLVRLEQTFFPAVMVAIFCLQLYPRDVGGPIGAFAMLLVLLSMSLFFRLLPEFMQVKVQAMLVEPPSARSASMGALLRRALVWLPLLGVVGLLSGYMYTVTEFALLLVKTIQLAAVILLFYELGLRWLRMTRRRMVVKVREELAQGHHEEGEERTEDDEMLENDPELLNDEGTRLLNVLTLIASLVGLAIIWSGMFPALSILESVELWSYSGVVEGEQALVPVTLWSLLVVIVLAVVGWIVLQRIPGLLEIFLRQKIGVRPASAYAATRVFQYAATGGLVVSAMSYIGFNWSQIQWAVAALSVGIGFGLQEIVANFISGLIILFEQPIRVGDIVTVGNVSGKVTKIRIRATTIRDFDQRELLVPNKEFITQQLLNWSLSDQVTRWSIEVGVAYGSDLDVAMAEVREALDAQPLIIRQPEPMVTFEQFGDNSLLIKARFFMDQLDQRLRVSSELMLDINRRLNERGIVVAFPQRDVHLDTSGPLEIRMV
jgi:potassium efflux system protein